MTKTPLTPEQMKKRRRLNGTIFAVGGGLLAIIIVAGIAGGAGGDETAAVPASPTTAASAPEATPSDAATAEAVEPSPNPTEVGPTVAEQVRASIDEQNTAAGQVPAWWAPVTDVEDLGGGTIRIHVQNELTDDDRDRLAQYVRNYTQLGDTPAVPDLGTIVVRDLTGTDSNHYA